MRIVNMVFSILIAICGLLYIIGGIHSGGLNDNALAIGWAMLAFAKLETLDGSIHEVNNKIENLKNK